MPQAFLNPKLKTVAMLKVHFSRLSQTNFCD